MVPTLDSPPKLLPAHRNLAWNIPATLNHERPVLAIMELKIRSGINLLEPGAPQNNLLRKALEYCSSLAEARVHCGQTRDQSSVIMLVELPSARAWQDLETSAALDLLVATFESNPVRNCLIWTTAQSFEISGTLELFTIHLGAGPEAFAYDRCRQFDRTWAAVAKDIAETGKQNAHGSWVEPYCLAYPFLHSPPGRAAFDAQPATFLGIICGDSADSEASQIAITKAVQKFEGSVSRRVLVLEPGLDQSQDVYTTHTSRAPLASPLSLFEPVKPIFRRNNGMDLRGEDMTWRSNYYAARRAKTGGFPEPCGRYHPLGTINQYSCPNYPDHEHVSEDTSPMIDTLSLIFRAGVLDASSSQAERLSKRFWRQVRREMEELYYYCQAVYWARKHGDANVVVLLIGNKCASGMLVKLANRAVVWRSGQKRPEDLLAVLSPFLQRSGILSLTERGPLQQCSFTLDTGRPPLPTAQYLELITFCTPDNPEARRLLQTHAKRYFYTALVVNVTAGRGSAGKCINSRYAHKRSDPGEHAALISLWDWRSLDAREKWYSQFHAIVQNKYEGLGHIVDGVRLVATGGIFSELLEMQL